MEKHEPLIIDDRHINPQSPLAPFLKRRAWNAGQPRIEGSGRKPKGAEARSAKVSAAVTPSVATLLQTLGGTQGDQLEAAIRELVTLRYAHNGDAIPEWFVLNPADLDDNGCVTLQRGPCPGALTDKARAEWRKAPIVDISSSDNWEDEDGNTSDEHPDYPKVDWQHELNTGDTDLSYPDWLQVQLEIAAMAPS